jgi:hypothetical protein
MEENVGKHRKILEEFIKASKSLRESVVQEDGRLLMYYNIGVGRV